MKKRIISTLTATVLAASAIPSFSAAAADDTYKTEHADGTYTEGWNLSGYGSIEMTDGKDGGFEGRFTDTVDCIFGSGMQYDQHEKRTISEMGDINVTYDAEFESSAFKYCGLECFTKSPLTAFYVIEGWDCEMPFQYPGSLASKKKPELLKTVEIDGSKYDLYQTDVTIIQNEIAGVILRFKQYWSVRQENAYKGEKKSVFQGMISLDDHIRAWESIGADVGDSKLSSAEFIMEFETDSRENPASGSCKASKVLFETANGAEAPAPETAVLYQEGFEDGTGRWKAQNSEVKMGSPKLECDAKNYAEGSHSLHVSNRDRGAYADLADIGLDIHKTYIIQAAVMQNSEAETEFRLQTEYAVQNQAEPSDAAWRAGGNMSGGAESCKKGEWMVLTFRFCMAEAPGIPVKITDEEVAEFRLSVESYGSSCDYWIDSVTIMEADADMKIDLSGAVTDGTDPVPGSSAQMPVPGTELCKSNTGDANCDGAVDVADAVLVLRYVSEDASAQMTTQGRENGDVNHDGQTDDKDAAMILQYIARKITF